MPQLFSSSCRVAGFLRNYFQNFLVINFKTLQLLMKDDKLKNTKICITFSFAFNQRKCWYTSYCWQFKPVTHLFTAEPIGNQLSSFEEEPQTQQRLFRQVFSTILCPQSKFLGRISRFQAGSALFMCLFEKKASDGQKSPVSPWSPVRNLPLVHLGGGPTNQLYTRTWKYGIRFIEQSFADSWS